MSTTRKQKYFVVVKARDPKKEAELLELLSSAGVDGEFVEFILPDALCDAEIVAGDVTLFLLEADADLDAFVDDASICADAKSQVVTLLGPETSIEGLTAIGAQIGSQCSWDAPSLKGILSSPGKTVSMTSSGKYIPRPKTGKVKCN